MPSVFISDHRQSSAMLATLVRRELQQKGITVFLDTQDMVRAGSFPELLFQEIEKADVFVCLLGTTTLLSEWVQKEIQHAFIRQKVMIPIMQEDFVKPDGVLPDHITRLLHANGIKVLDKSNEYIDSALSKLVTMINDDIPRVNKLYHFVHVEDDDALRDIFKISLELSKISIELKQFANSDVAVQYIEENIDTIDLFILDIRLPGQLDGLGIAKRIRELHCKSVIIITSAYRAPDRELMSNLNAEWYPKPWHLLEAQKFIAEAVLARRDH